MAVVAIVLLLVVLNSIPQCTALVALKPNNLHLPQARLKFPTPSVAAAVRSLKSLAQLHGSADKIFGNVHPELWQRIFFDVSLDNDDAMWSSQELFTFLHAMALAAQTDNEIQLQNYLQKVRLYYAHVFLPYDLEYHQFDFYSTLNRFSSSYLTWPSPLRRSAKETTSLLPEWYMLFQEDEEDEDEPLWRMEIVGGNVVVHFKQGHSEQNLLQKFLAQFNLISNTPPLELEALAVETPSIVPALQEQATVQDVPKQEPDEIDLSSTIPFSIPSLRIGVYSQPNKPTAWVQQIVSQFRQSLEQILKTHIRSISALLCAIMKIEQGTVYVIKTQLNNDGIIHLRLFLDRVTNMVAFEKLVYNKAVNDPLLYFNKHV